MSERLDRIEAAIEAEQRLNQEQFEQRQQEFETQMALNAEFRTRQELQSQQIEAMITAQRERDAIQRERDIELREVMFTVAHNIEALTQNVSALTQEFRQHRSDGHGS
jgi:hypothetical protein